MPIGGDLYQFNADEVKDAPTDHGLYALYDGDEIIFIGKAKSGLGIRGALFSHLRGDVGSCSQGATHFRRELDPSPPVRYSELIEEFKRERGDLPRCNERGTG